MPIVASMGGVAGSQTLTVVVRGMVLGQIERSNIKWLLSKEFIVGAFNGILWALVMGVLVSLWLANLIIALIIGLAMTINLMAATISGTVLPVLLRKINIDPALAGTVIVTTVTDIVGFVLLDWRVFTLMTEDAEFEGEELVSKSQPRESQALQDMGSQLVEMLEASWRNLPPENLDAIHEARRLKNREGKRASCSILAN